MKRLDFIAIGGGSAGVAMFGSIPEKDAAGGPIGWRVGAVEYLATSNNWNIEAQVLCADLDVLLFEASTTTRSASSKDLRKASLCTPMRMVFERGSTTATMRRSRCSARRAASVLAIAVG